jgi:hypothetical protein
MPLTLESLLVLIVWVTPGYFFFNWITHLNPYFFKDSDVWKTAVVAVPLSVIVYLVQGFLWPLIGSMSGMDDSVPSFSSLFFLTDRSERILLSTSEMAFLFSSLAITPHLLGIAAGAALQSRRVQIVLKKLSLDESSMSLSAWDSSLYFRREGAWVVITLDDGEQIGGSLGRAAEIAKSSDGGDVFLQEEWRVEDGYLAEVRYASQGIWVKGETIRSVRLIRGGEDE